MKEKIRGDLNGTFPRNGAAAVDHASDSGSLARIWRFLGTSRGAADRLWVPARPPKRWLRSYVRLGARVKP